MATTKPKGKTLADFRNTYDRNIVVPNKIRAALTQLESEGPESWEYELDLMKRAGVSQTDIAMFREQFQGHIVEARAIGGQSKRIWFASAKVAAKARGE